MRNLFSFVSFNKILLFIVVIFQIIIFTTVYRNNYFDVHYFGFEDYKPYHDDAKYHEYQKKAIGALENFNSYYLIDIVDENQYVSLKYGHINNLRSLEVHGTIFHYSEDYYWIFFAQEKIIGVCNSCSLEDVQLFVY